MCQLEAGIEFAYQRALQYLGYDLDSTGFARSALPAFVSAPGREPQATLRWCSSRSGDDWNTPGLDQGRSRALIRLPPHLNLFGPNWRADSSAGLP